MTPIFDQLVTDMELFLSFGEHDPKVSDLFAREGWFNWDYSGPLGSLRDDD